MAAVGRAAATRESLTLHSVNAHWLRLVGTDPSVAALADRFDLGLLDSTLLCRIVERRTGVLPERITGSDLVPALCADSARTGLRLFFLGAAPGVGAKAAERAEALYPGCRIAGVEAPAPAEIDDPDASRALCARINAARADVLLVALGMPRQERWLVRHRDDLEAPVRMGVGASLDFLAGRVKRAPRFIQRAGLEWAWRLAAEPRRLWRRYLVEDLPVMARLLRETPRRTSRRSPSIQGGKP